MSKVIVVTNQKGGVGKTTTVISLAYALTKQSQQQTKKILIIDSDPQANCTSGIGKSNASPNLYQVLIGQATLRQAIIPTNYSHLFLIPGNQDLIGFNIEFVNEDGRAEILKKQIETIWNDFDFIFIDTPPSLELLTLNAIVAANSILIPIQCEYFALEGISKLLKTIKQIKTTYHPKLFIEGITLNMYDSRTRISKEVVENVVQHFGKDVYKTIIPRNVKISEAPSFGQPIGVYAPDSLGAKCYTKLAEEFLNKQKQV